MVELSEGIRKVRRVFLFHDVIVSSKQKPTRTGMKFEPKWFLPLSELVFHPPEDSAEGQLSCDDGLVISLFGVYLFSSLYISLCFSFILSSLSPPPPFPLPLSPPPPFPPSPSPLPPPPLSLPPSLPAANRPVQATSDMDLSVMRNRIAELKAQIGKETPRDRSGSQPEREGSFVSTVDCTCSSSNDMIHLQVYTCIHV